MTTPKTPLVNSLPHVELPQLPDVSVDSDHVLHLLRAVTVLPATLKTRSDLLLATGTAKTTLTI